MTEPESTEDSVKYRTDIAKLLARYAIPAGECVEWTGYKNHLGYGRAYVTLADGSHKLLAVHRLAYELENGDLEPGAVIMHSCDNRACINAAHLSLGDRALNNADMWAKGRAWQQKLAKEREEARPPLPLPPSDAKPDQLELPGEVWTPPARDEGRM